MKKKTEGNKFDLDSLGVTKHILKRKLIISIWDMWKTKKKIIK